jgi:hypothetical protein
MIEQVLAVGVEQESATVTWLSASPKADGIALTYHHVVDAGREDFVDVYDVSPVSDDEELGEGRLLGVFPDVSTALEQASTLGAGLDLWVNEGMVQDEYADMRHAL